jgi:hypothetical protein
METRSKTQQKRDESRPGTPLSTPEEILVTGDSPESCAKECMICLEPVEGNKNIFVTECDHTFHASCMVKQLRHSSKCPVCRHKLGPNPTQVPEFDEEVIASLIQTAFNSPVNRDDYFGGQTGFAARHYRAIEGLLPPSYRHPDWNQLEYNVRNAQANIMDRILMRFGTTLCQHFGDWLVFQSQDPDEEGEAEGVEAEGVDGEVGTEPETDVQQTEVVNRNELPLSAHGDTDSENNEDESYFQESQDMWVPESQLEATLEVEMDLNMINEGEGLNTPPRAASPVAPPPLFRARQVNSGQQQERLIQNMMDLLFNAQNPHASRTLFDDSARIPFPPFPR